MWIWIALAVCCIVVPILAIKFLPTDRPPM